MDTKLVRVDIPVHEEITKQMHRFCLDTRKSAVAMAVALLRAMKESDVRRRI
jgi:hypothetical protein